MKRFFISGAFFLLSIAIAHAQVIGSNNGSGNGTGAGNGNGNGNGTGNGNGIVTFNSRGNTPSFAAPGLAAAGIESCLASASAGGAGGGLAVTIAGPILDQGCNIRLFSRTLFATGHRVAATQLLCNDPQVAAALATEGVRCLVGVGAQVQNEMQSPPPPQHAELFGGMFGCRHYVLFQGCLDEQPPSMAAYVEHHVRSRHRLARRIISSAQTASTN